VAEDQSTGDQSAMVAAPLGEPATVEGPPSTPRTDGSLGIGSLKGEIPHE